MALPRETILANLRTTLLAITSAGGFNNTIQTVIFGAEPPGSVLDDPDPIVFIDAREDDEFQESFGGGDGNTYHRLWRCELTALFRLKAGEDVRARGETMLTDLVKVLADNRQVIAGIAVVHRFGRFLGPNDFDRHENDMARVGLDVYVMYQFTPDTI